jgi:hypothetical protein
MFRKDDPEIELEISSKPVNTSITPLKDLEQHKVIDQCVYVFWKDWSKTEVEAFRNTFTWLMTGLGEAQSHIMLWLMFVKTSRRLRWKTSARSRTDHIRWFGSGTEPSSVTKAFFER